MCVCVCECVRAYLDWLHPTHEPTRIVISDCTQMYRTHEREISVNTYIIIIAIQNGLTKWSLLPEIAYSSLPYMPQSYGKCVCVFVCNEGWHEQKWDGYTSKSHKIVRIIMRFSLSRCCWCLARTQNTCTLVRICVCVCKRARIRSRFPFLLFGWCWFSKFSLYTFGWLCVCVCVHDRVPKYWN